MTSSRRPPYDSLRLNTIPVEADSIRAHYPALFLSCLQGDGRASKFFAHRHRDPELLLRRARAAAERGMEKGVLETLRRHHLEMDAPAASMAALEKLGKGAAAVVTGQQPSVGFGPLYNIYKARTALALAAWLESKGVPAAAVFWNHSDDVRGGDAVGLPDRENRVREVRLPEPPAGTPLYETGSGEILRMFASVLAEALPHTEFSPALGEVLQSTHRGSIAEAFTRTLLAALGGEGLVVLEPRHLEGERAAGFFERHLREPGKLSRAVEEGRRAVIAEGLEDHLGRDVGLDLFEVRSGRRLRVESPGAAKGRLSAGVALRPLLQDAVLPTAVYVGGPSEVGYQAALLPAYREFGIDPPVVFPRITATLLEPKIARLVEKAGLSPADLFGAEAALGPRFQAAGEDGLPGRLKELSARVIADVDALTEPLSSSPSIAKARERTAGRIGEALEALAERVRDELSRQDTTARGQISKLLVHLRPSGKLQERVFTPLYYQALFGPAFLRDLAGALDPFRPAHQLVFI